MAYATAGALPQKRKAEELGGDWRNGSGFRPRKMCSFFLEGRCQKGTSCSFAHSREELHPEAQEEQEPEESDAGIDISQIVNFAADLSREAEPDPEQGEVCASSLVGPREFESLPRRLCQLWLRHPALCRHGDKCTNAHGLFEMGFEASTVVKLQTTRTDIPIQVELLDSKPPSIVRPPTLQQGDWSKGSDWGKGDYGKGFGPFSYKGPPPMQALTMGSSADFGGKGKGSPVPPSRFSPNGGFQPTKLCQFWLTDPSACQKGDGCSFAHGVQELAPHVVATCGVSRFHHSGFQPKEMCKFYALGNCAKNMSCTYAHSQEELGAYP